MSEARQKESVEYGDIMGRARGREKGRGKEEGGRENPFQTQI